MTQKTPKQQPSVYTSVREDRVASALRENLKKRKQQQQARHMNDQLRDVSEE